MTNYQQGIWHMKRALDLYETERIWTEYIHRLLLNNETLWAGHYRNYERSTARQAEYHNRKSQEYFYGAKNDGLQ